MSGEVPTWIRKGGQVLWRGKVRVVQDFWHTNIPEVLTVVLDTGLHIRGLRDLEPVSKKTQRKGERSRYYTALGGDTAIRTDLNGVCTLLYGTGDHERTLNISCVPPEHRNTFCDAVDVFLREVVQLTEQQTKGAIRYHVQEALRQLGMKTL